MNKKELVDWLVSHARRADRKYWTSVVESYGYDSEEGIAEEVDNCGSEEEFLSSFLYDDDYNDDGSNPKFDLEREKIRRKLLGPEWYDSMYSEESWFNQVVAN